jgi:fission process protein 1
VVPFLPYLFDKPVEHAVEWSFHKGFEAFGGTESTKSKMPGYGQPATKKEKEKEL